MTIVIDTMEEEKKHSYWRLCSASQPQSNFTTFAKTSPFQHLFNVPRPKTRSFGDATSMANILDVIIKKNNPLFVTFCWLGQSQSLFTTAKLR